MKKVSFYLFVVFLSTMLSCTDKEIKLTVLGENSANLNAMEALKGNYEKQNNVKITFRPNTFEDAFNKSNQDFANKTGLYDIVLQYNFSLSSFVRNDYVYTLKDLRDRISEADRTFEKDLFQNVWKEVGYYYENPHERKGEQQIGYPFAANTLILVYNKALFESPIYKKEYFEKFNVELKIPSNLEEYVQVANFFNKPEKNIKGVCMQGAEGGWLYYEWSCLLLASGGQLMDKEYGWQGDEKTKINLTSKESFKATQALLDLKETNAGDYVRTDANEQAILMKEGNIAMAIMWSDYLYGFLDKGNGNLDKRFGFAPIPGSLSPIAGGSFYINKQSKHPDEALKYVISLLQKDNQIELMKNGYCSPLKDAYNSNELADIPYINALYNSLNRAVYAFEAGPDSDMISQIITVYLQKLWNVDIKDINRALTEAQKEIEVERVKILNSLN